ncbi:MAG: hypothetical protein FJ318_03625 [SAR202 cluster bacterium]|nr:hypothetical protein [SAR202 cluster bacterium]
MLAFASIARAGHEHFLVTPGTCVEDIAKGQTAIGDPDHGGYHRFHTNVHAGTPGGAGGPLHRDGQAPVIVDKTVGGNPANLAACEAA